MDTYEILNTARKEKNYTLSKLAKESGLSYSKIYRMLNNPDHKPQIKDIKKINIVLKLNLNYILNQYGYINDQTTQSQSNVPLLKWDHILNYFPFASHIQPGLSNKTIITNKKITKGFATTITTNQFEPHLFKGNILICGPEEPIKQNDLVLFKLNKTLTIGTIKIIQNQTFINLLDPTIKQNIMPINDPDSMFLFCKITEIYYKDYRKTQLIN